MKQMLLKKKEIKKYSPIAVTEDHRINDAKITNKLQFSQVETVFSRDQCILKFG